MGKHNSSKTRVEPVFERLSKSDPTGESWLPKLLKLPICGNTVSLAPNCLFGIQEKFWGGDELKLDPPLALLSWLIRHPQELARCEAARDTRMTRERRELLDGSRDRMLEALALLRNNPNGKDWHIFEGKTQPDVCIMTPSLVVVIEGKRTEKEPTTATRWMLGRHQVIRHLDGAWEIRGKRHVIGFFIVEGEGEEVPASWREFAINTTSTATIASSLPHRGPSEQNEIASCFAGVTTWQRLCKEYNIEHRSLPDEVLVDEICAARAADASGV
jgi:hypothetical protein